MRVLTSTDAVIDALGGTCALARLLECGATRVSHWRLNRAGLFPSWTYDGIQKALAEIGCEAPPTCWKTVPPDALTRVLAEGHA